MLARPQVLDASFTDAMSALYLALRSKTIHDSSSGVGQLLQRLDFNGFFVRTNPQLLQLLHHQAPPQHKQQQQQQQQHKKQPDAAGALAAVQ
jgi:hypothetical protein